MRLHSFTIRATALLGQPSPGQPNCSRRLHDRSPDNPRRSSDALGPPSLSVLALLCVGLSAVAPAGAQQIPSSYRYLDDGQKTGVFGAYLNLTRGKWDLGPRSAAYAGGRYSIEVSGPLFAEGLLTYVPTTRNVVDPRRAEGDRSIGETDVHLMLASARLAFSLTGRRTWRRIAPHIFAGTGVAIDVAGMSDTEETLQPEDRFEFGTTSRRRRARGFGSRRPAESCCGWRAACCCGG